MNPKNLMLPFYFGTLTEEERIFMEREVLSDPEVLVDYLDLKRKVESANQLVMQPSLGLWEKIKPKTKAQQRTWMSLSLGAALAASLVFLFMFQNSNKVTEIIQPSAQGALFDSSSELPASSSVL